MIKSASTAADIDEALQACKDNRASTWLPKALRFGPALEAVFEAHTGRVRASELAYFVGWGMVLSYLLILSDYVFTPYLFLSCAYLRLIPAPFALLVVLRRGRSSPRIREASTTVFALSIVAVVTTIASIAREPLAPYTYFMATLAILVVTIAFPLRFGQACVFAGCGIVTIAASMALFRHPRTDLFIACMMVVALPTAFALIASYRTERIMRTAWLLSARETLRLASIEAAREELEVIAKTDGLTGLANRGHFDRQLASRVASTCAAGKVVWLILLDVDFFKRYNDAHGHPAGDTCLRIIAQILAETTRGRDDFAFRYGGEEFGVLLCDVTDAVAVQAAERIRQAVEQAAVPHGNRGDDLAVVTVSIGMSRLVLDSASKIKELIEDADAALYRAKQQGRNRIQAAWKVVAVE